MSHTEIAIPQVYSATFGPLVAGVLAAAPVANFNGTSEVLSINRLVLGAGVAGVPHAIVTAPTNAGAVPSQWALGVASSVNTDVGTYQVNWVNKALSTSYLSAGVVNGVAVTPAVGQYYAP